MIEWNHQSKGNWQDEERNEAMTTTEMILKSLVALPPSAQQEVLDFVEMLGQRQQLESVSEDAAEDWSNFSLAQALRGMEDETPAYDVSDLKERF